MRQTQHGAWETARRRSRRSVAALGGVVSALAALAVASCTYDFDAAFSETPVGPGAGGQGGGAAGGSGATSTGGSGGSGASSTGGEGGAIGEDCTNGLDDDEDLAVDCEDPDCGAFACAATPPVNWIGPIAFALVPGADPLPDCAPVWSTSSSAWDGSTGEPVSCTPCTCGTPTVGCTNPRIDFSLSGSCNLTVFNTTPDGAETCTPFEAGDPFSYVRGRTPSPAGLPSCEPAGGELVDSEPVWDVHARLCSQAPPGGGCAPDSVCVPGPTVSFAVCIYRSGDEVCPPGYPQKTLLYSSFDEGRSCSNCICLPAGGASCTGETDLWFASSDCSGLPDLTIPNDYGTCTHVTPTGTSGSLMFHPAGTANPCIPEGGVGSGDVTPTEPLTVCCLQ